MGLAIFKTPFRRSIFQFLRPFRRLVIVACLDRFICCLNDRANKQEQKENKQDKLFFVVAIIFLILYYIVAIYKRKRGTQTTRTSKKQTSKVGSDNQPKNTNKLQE